MGRSEPDLKLIFTEASALPPGAGRSAYLDGACRGDAALRGRVETLLAAQEEVGRFLGTSDGPDATKVDLPATGPIGITSGPVLLTTSGAAGTVDAQGWVTPGQARPGATEGPGTRIGPYKLLQRIGEGGMGVVYMAEQEAPVRRKVALKVIKPGMDTGQVVARFEAERQALAMMDHPHIARVFDAGATDAGRPYFVMELVGGVPITEYCDAHHLSPRERLELFVPVCRAIQHAHQKGIIHRDVKPSNVLVTLVDGRPTPKVIDFGVAKAVEQRLTERSLFTQFGAVIGTLEYMSPEQAEMGGLDVDTRTDVFALGVLLYELLTGSTPLERARLRRAGYAEILRRIKEEEPPRPSTRLSDSGESLPSIAANRRTEPSRLAGLMRGELDWIAMRALEKDRTRRYETANALARDVERYLADESVEACPPSRSYRVRKFARRHRTALATATAFAGLLVAATVVSAGLAWWANAQRVRAIGAEAEAVRIAGLERLAAERERAAREVAQARLGQIEKANDVLASIFRDLDPRAEQKGARPLRVILGDRLDRAAAQLGDGREIGDPLTQAKLMEVLGRTQNNLGFPERGLPLLARALRAREEALGPDHIDTLSSRKSLAEAYRVAGRTAEAIPLIEETSRRTSATLGPEHADTLNDLGAAYLAAGRVAEAVALHEDTYKRMRATRGPDDANTLIAASNLASAYDSAGRDAESLALREDVLPRSEALHGPDHRDTLVDRMNLGEAYRKAGRTAEALAMHEETLRRLIATHGPDHPHTLIGQGNLARAYKVAGRLDRAIPLSEAVAASMTKKLGPDHRHTLTSQNNLATAYEAAGQVERAIALHERTLSARKAALGPDHPDSLASRGHLIRLFDVRGESPRSEPLLREALGSARTEPGAGPSTRSVALAALGDNLLKQRRWADAEPVLREGLAIREAVLPEDWSTSAGRSSLGASLLGQGKYAEAEPLLIRGYEGLKARVSGIPPRSRSRLAEAGGRIVALYEAWGKPEKAAEWRAKTDPDAGFPADPFARGTIRGPAPRAGHRGESAAPTCQLGRQESATDAGP